MLVFWPRVGRRTQLKIRMKMMEKAGKARREDSDAGDEWVIIDEDESHDTVNEVKEALVR